MKVGALSVIHSGYTARAKLRLLENGVPALQLRDVSGDPEATGPTLQRYDLGKLPDRYFVRGGEVVFRSRGEPNIAAVVSDTLPEPAAVIVPLVIVRPDKEKVLPEYLAWAINHPDAQRQLDAEAQGTSLRMIPMVALENLEIPVPDMSQQRCIVRLDALAKQEVRLLRQLAERREELVTAILGKAAKATDQKEIA